MRQFTSTPFSSQSELCDWLNQFQHPQLVEGWANTHGMISLDTDNAVVITLPFASSSLQAALSVWITAAQNSGEVASFAFRIEMQVKALKTPVTHAVRGVKNIIAVTSAKGGVGKSTTAVNLALAIAHSGAKVGLLDADIYGPSVPMMLGKIDAAPKVRDNKWMQPIEAYGIKTHSIGYLVSSDDAAIWRGPMASKALTQLLNETEWHDLDYLVIDMPPGTGDIQLTLSQQIPVTGAVIITTPQDLALADARKGAAMFEKVDVPVVGLVENMSYHICSHCGAHEALFGVGGAQKMAAEYGLALLAQLPLHLRIREDVDVGCPTVAADPHSEFAQPYLQLADNVCSRLFWQGEVKPDPIAFTVVE